MASVNRVQAGAAWQNAMNGEQMVQNDALRASYTGVTANSQAALARAQALGATTTAGLAPALAKSQIGLQGTQAGENVARAGYYGAQSGLTGAQTAMENAKLQGGKYLVGPIAANMGFSLPAPAPMAPPPKPPTLDNLGEEDDEYGFSKGTARVPGKGSGKVDTVPARLAPGEAVLNKGANDAMPQGLVAALNAMGAAKMGLTAPDAGQQTPTPPGYAKGTSNVRSPSKRSDTPLLTPQMMQMLMQAQGGGAPQGGGGILTADPRAQALGMP